MKKIVLVMVLVLFFAGCGDRTPVGSTGLIMESNKEYKLLDYVKMIRSFSKDPEKRDRKNLPESVDLAAHFPKPGNQGAQGSCVTWAASYGVKSFQEYREFGWSFANANHLFSPSYVYNKINAGADQGTTLLKAVTFMKEDGTVPLSIMPYDDLDYVTQPTGEQVELGKNFKIEAYRRVSEKNIEELKRHLASEEPVLFVLEVYSNMLGDEFRKNKNIYSKKGGDFLANHAVVLVGYDNDKETFKFLNSWGAGWGDGGYGWITYKFLPKVAKRAYVIYDSPSPRKVIAYLNEIDAGDIGEYELAMGDPQEFHKGQTGKEETKTTKETKPVAVTLAAPPPETEKIKSFFFIPEERGLYVNGDWIRIGDPISKVKEVFKGLIDPGMTNKGTIWVEDERGRTIFTTEPDSDRIGQISFSHAQKHKSVGRTNRGLTIGDSIADAHRMYGKPDFTSSSKIKQSNVTVGREVVDYYFYEAVSEDYGGLSWEKNITMEVASRVSPNDKGKIWKLRLLKTDKRAIMGTYGQEVAEEEKKQVGEGLKITSDDISFTIPKGFPSPEKSDWGELGYGYFADSEDPKKSIVVKVFNFKKQIKKEGKKKALDIFIRSELSKNRVEYPAGGLEEKKWGNASWQVQSNTPAFGKQIRAYTIEGKKLYTLQMFSKDVAWLDSNEVKKFLASIEID